MTGYNFEELILPEKGAFEAELVRPEAKNAEPIRYVLILRRHAEADDRQSRVAAVNLDVRASGN